MTSKRPHDKAFDPAQSPQQLSWQLSKYLRMPKPEADIVRDFIGLGADLHARHDAWQRTPLISAVEKGYTDIIAVLLQHMDTVDDCDNQGNTALMWAADVHIARMLLDKGADIHTRNHQQSTLLIDAVQSNNPELLSFFLQHMPEDINIQNEDGTTALILAATTLEFDALDILLAHKADPRLVDNSGETAWMKLNAPAAAGTEVEAAKKKIHDAEIECEKIIVGAAVVAPIARPAARPHLVRPQRKGI